MQRNEMRLNLKGFAIQKSLHRFLIQLLPNISWPVAFVYLSYYFSMKKYGGGHDVSMLLD